MNLNLKMDKEQLKMIGSTGLRIGKAIVVEGTKALVLKTAAKAITTSFEDGFSGVKQLGLDDVLGKKEDKPKKKWFSKKKNDAEEVLEEISSTIDTDKVVGIKINDADIEIIDKKKWLKEDFSPSFFVFTMKSNYIMKGND